MAMLMEGIAAPAGANNMEPEIVIFLKATEDKFGGLIIDSPSLPRDTSVFLHSLQHSLVKWKAQGKRGVWLKLPLDQSELVHLAIQEGFKYHHAESTYVMLVTWLADDVPSTIPANASHQVGVGAFVLNSKGEVLAVQEKSGVFQGGSIWKMPTGSVNQGEDIFAGAIREVKEETGIDTEFVQVVGFRQAHKVAFEKSDIFFLCVLRPLTSGITVQDTELTAAKWMPLAEFREQDYLKQRKMLKKMLDVCIATTEEPAYQGFKMEDMQAGTGRRPQNFFYNA
ncbi:hypothetical protein M758_6G099000 [Ceratodon purpureus]|uniref:Nudix hydrolase domain-containing protein n=1 Tax=Ceratodon purpureus TaxID=3225 RepID=A0A8T0HDL4_CERPU|nr:hypothetical protein KC19_6G102700 [Ceratodon purpureus]KAG0569614.1 hypothetical protein KC19_6G102700 [Ceratodon purpureus]KAG0569615.1 hypothetical protein KC19_6G102700 [Ceratodon purpureus]KAG0613384.1 hypothetical protein M758_6G099000 [Ceratodon purpureus]